jgi:HlyD family secretion protein
MTGPESRGITTSTIVVILIIIVTLSVGALMLRGGFAAESTGGTPDLFTVQRGDFDVTVPASGELAALRQTEISSQLEIRAVITYIVEEGEWVNKGDVLIRLNDEDLQDRLKDAQDAANTADASYIAAKSNLEIAKQTNQSELDEADVQITLAQLALEAWREGDSQSKIKSLELELETAEKDYTRLVERFDASKKLLENNFISEDEYKRDEISMIQAKSRKEQADLAIKVYTQYTYKQEKEQKESDLKQAQDRKKQLEARHATQIESLRSDVDSKLFQLNSRKDRLEKLQRQVEQCTIRAPQDGLVVYRSSLGDHRREEDRPEVGTELPRNRTVIILPDTSQMVAEVKVNEALTGRIQKGQRAVVYCDAVPDTPMHGEVLGVGVMAEGGGWRDPNRRDYTVRIKLDGGNEYGLKPSMRCKSEIYVDRVQNALYVPIQAIFRKGPLAFVYVPDSNGYAETPVKLGRASEMYIEVFDGLEEGQSVLLREPAATRITQEIDREEFGIGANGMAPNGRPSGPQDMERGRRPGESSADREGAPDDRNAARGGQRPGDRERRPGRARSADQAGSEHRRPTSAGPPNRSGGDRRQPSSKTDDSD